MMVIVITDLNIDYQNVIRYRMPPTRSSSSGQWHQIPMSSRPAWHIRRTIIGLTITIPFLPLPMIIATPLRHHSPSRHHNIPECLHTPLRHIDTTIYYECMVSRGTPNININTGHRRHTATDMAFQPLMATQPIDASACLLPADCLYCLRSRLLITLIIMIIASHDFLSLFSLTHTHWHCLILPFWLLLIRRCRHWDTLLIIVAVITLLHWYWVTLPTLANTATSYTLIYAIIFTHSFRYATLADNGGARYLISYVGQTAAKNTGATIIQKNNGGNGYNTG